MDLEHWLARQEEKYRYIFGRYAFIWSLACSFVLLCLVILFAVFAMERQGFSERPMIARAKRLSRLITRNKRWLETMPGITAVASAWDGTKLIVYANPNIGHDAVYAVESRFIGIPIKWMTANDGKIS